MDKAHGQSWLDTMPGTILIFSSLQILGSRLRSTTLVVVDDVGMLEVES